MEFRWLSGDEILEWVNPVCAQRGWAQLNINDAQPTCRVLGAFDGPALTGFIVVQLHPVIGPAWVDSEHRDGALSHSLADRMHEYMVEAGARGALTICESPVTERLAKRHNMTKVEEPVYLWVGGA